MNKVRLYWTLQFGGWMAFALIQIAVFRTSNITQIIFWLLEASLFLISTHILRNLIVRQRWLALNMASLIPRTLISVMALGLIVYCIRVLITIPLGIYDSEVAWGLVQVVGLTAVFALIFFVWSVLYYIYHYFEQYNISLKHEAAVHQIELNNLKSQLNPHFIFNALNSIRALVDEDPVRSKSAITKLSNILRNSLASDKKKLTSFEEELMMVQDYLGLESIRFEERLKTDFDIHPESYNFRVPPLMLQTLVENCIKHGISKLKKGGFVKVKTFVADNKLKVQIRNTGHMAADPVKETPGLGIKNTSQRLELIYADGATFRIFNENKDTVVTELVIPQSK